MNEEIIHATAIAITGNGVLLAGPSGSGKSDLALRLIDRGAKLVSDDAVTLASVNSKLVVGTAPNIADLIEVRGVGICTVASIPSAPLRLVVKLVNDVERLPTDDMTIEICDYAVPVIHLSAFDVSSAIKVEYALRRIVDDELWPVAITIQRQNEGTHF